jgi:cell division protein FtsZ
MILLKPVAKVEEVIPEEMNITMKQVDSTTKPLNSKRFSYGNDNRRNFSLRADERRRKLKEFNYKFHNNVSKIDEYERELLINVRYRYHHNQ